MECPYCCFKYSFESSIAIFRYLLTAVLMVFDLFAWLVSFCCSCVTYCWFVDLRSVDDLLWLRSYVEPAELWSWCYVATVMLWVRTVMLCDGLGWYVMWWSEHWSFLPTSVTVRWLTNDSRYSCPSVDYAKDSMKKKVWGAAKNYVLFGA